MKGSFCPTPSNLKGGGGALCPTFEEKGDCVRGAFAGGGAYVCSPEKWPRKLASLKFEGTEKWPPYFFFGCPNVYTSLILLNSALHSSHKDYMNDS